MTPHGAVLGILADQARQSGSAAVAMLALAVAWRTRDLLATILADMATL